MALTRWAYVTLAAVALLLPGCMDGCRPDGYEGTWSQPGTFQALLASAHADFRLVEADGFAWNRSDLDALLPGRYDATSVAAIVDEFYFRLDADGSLHVEAQRPSTHPGLRAALEGHLRNVTRQDVETLVTGLIADLEDGFEDDRGRTTAVASARLSGPFDLSGIQFGSVAWSGVGEGVADWGAFAASGYPSDRWRLTITLDRFEHRDPDEALRVDARDQASAHLKGAETDDAFRQGVAAILAKAGVAPPADADPQPACK